MSIFKKLIDKYNGIIKEITDERLNLSLIMASDTFQLVAERIQETGTGADGVKFPLYSKNLMPYWLINPSDFNGSAKIAKFKKDAAKGKNNGSYDALRKVYGVPTDKRTLTLDGDMFKSIVPTVESHTKTKTVVVLRAKDKTNQNKVNWNSNQLGINILSWSKEEDEFMGLLNKKRIEKLIK